MLRRRTCGVSFARRRARNAMKKGMPSELEKALQEIEQLRQENAKLRRKLGVDVSEPQAYYRQTSPTPVVFHARVEEAHEGRSYGSNEPISAKPPRIESNFSAEEKIKLFRMFFRGREDVYAVFWFNERTGKKGYSPACEDP